MSSYNKRPIVVLSAASADADSKFLLTSFSSLVPEPPSRHLLVFSRRRTLLELLLFPSVASSAWFPWRLAPDFSGNSGKRDSVG